MSQLALLPLRPAAPLDLRVASYNVHKCIGTDGRYDPDRVIQVIAELGADLVALQEVDRRFGRRTARLDAVALERATGLLPVPVSPLHDGLGWHGNALLVRPGTRWRVRRLDLPGGEPRGAVIADLALAGSNAPLRVVATHFGLLGRSRERQVRFILDAVAEAPPMPTLLLGDLNEWRGEGRSALRGLETLFGPVAGGPASFPARRPFLSLDRILGCERAWVRMLEVHASPLARQASDHLPLMGRVALRAAAETVLAEAA